MSIPDQVRLASKHRDSLGQFLEKQAKYVLLMPAVLAVVALFIYPLLYNVNLSVRDIHLLNIRRGGSPFTGIRSFVQLLQRPSVLQALLHTIGFGGVSLVIELVLGMVMALVFNRDFVGKNLLMTICLIPMLLTPIAVGMFWRFLLNYQWGLVNYLIGLVGVEPQAWLGIPRLGQVSVVVVTVWRQLPFVFLVFLGGLSSLPVDLFEVAEVDGASGWQKFRFITLPLMAPVIMVVTIMRTIDAFRAFDLVFALTMGGPGDATRVISYELYEIAFRAYKYSQAAALSMLMSIVMLALAFLLMRFQTETSAHA